MPQPVSSSELDGGQIAESTSEREAQLSEIDRKLLSLIQSDFPLDPKPYAVIGAKLGLTESEALARVRAMRERKLIRRIGANFQSAKLGFRSTLCAAKVPEDKMGLFIAEVNKRPGVTHNYIREHSYNIWFTFIGPSWEQVLKELAEIEHVTGIPVLNLPAEKLYKIKVDFQLG